MDIWYGASKLQSQKHWPCTSAERQLVIATVALIVTSMMHNHAFMNQICARVF